MRNRPPGGIEWTVDRGLQVRMIAGLTLLVVFPIAFVVLLEWALTTVVPAVTRTLTGTDPQMGTFVDWRVLVVAVVGGLAVQYRFGDRFALRSLRALPTTENSHPDLHAIVGRLAAQAGVPKPDIAIVDAERAPNAFATGRSPKTATIVVTSGLVEQLDEDELEAVLAHELAHVVNRDATVMTVAYLLPTITYLVVTSAYTILRTVFGSFRYMRTSHNNDGRALFVVIVVLVTTTIVTIAVATLFWVASFLLYRLLSQYREYAADRGAAQLTGDPLALAGALETIDGELASAPDRDLRTLDGGVEALYVAPIDFAQFTDEGDDGLLSKDVFPETHPDTDARIERLQEMADEMA